MTIPDQTTVSRDVSPGLTVGITTRNRPAALVRCVRSVALVADIVREIIVFDDASDTPVRPQLLRQVPADLRSSLQVLRVDRQTGQQAGRNRILRSARSRVALLLDDDAALLDARSVKAALATISGNPRVGAVAFAQADANGEPWPVTMQPSSVSYTCRVPAFIGFAHLIRRDLFLELGGYRRTFYYHGEEKEFCLRLLDAGYDVVYMPEAKVAHVPDPGGRSTTMYLRYVARNDCLGALYNDPWWRVLWTVPGRLALYFKMRRSWGVDDPGGFAWLLREIAAQLPAVVRERRPVRAATFRRWKQIRRTSPAYPIPPASPSSTTAGWLVR